MSTLIRCWTVLMDGCRAEGVPAPVITAPVSCFIVLLLFAAAMVVTGG